MDPQDLILNVHRLHTTPMGVSRVRRNLKLRPGDDVVAYCRQCVLARDANICRRGKNWYVSVGDVCITIHAGCLTIITAHGK